jgi:acyl-CoA thioester hydrolase
MGDFSGCSGIANHLMSAIENPVVVEARQRVIYGDTDQMKVVYYANYLRWFELGRLEYFKARGGDYAAMEAKGFALPVATAHADYRAPARYEDVVLIRTWLAEQNRASLKFEYELRREADQVLLCTGYTLHACVGPNGKPTRLPEELTRFL